MNMSQVSYKGITVMTGYSIHRYSHPYTFSAQNLLSKKSWTLDTDLMCESVNLNWTSEAVS